MKKRITNKMLQKQINEYEKRFLKQKQFPPFIRPYTDRIVPINHTGHFIFIRSKFLFLATIRSFDDKNLFASYALLKSYWENVAAFGYYYLRIKHLIDEKNIDDAFNLSMKMRLGGRGFVTEEMAKNKEHSLDDFTLPNIITMMEKVDKDWQKKLGKDINVLSKIYKEQIAEGGHTTFIGLDIAARWLPDRSQVADIKKSWDRKEYSSVLNLLVLSTKVFFYYWDKFNELPSSIDG